MKPADTWHLDTIHIGRRVLVFDRLDSTSNAAAALANDLDNDGLVILADEQTAGRGQHGRSWACPAGTGVLMSVLLFPPPELRRPALLTAWAAVAVCRSIENLYRSRDRKGAEKTLPYGRGSLIIKWPNDVLIRGRKVCGILIETRNVEGHMAVVAGIGLNVNQTAEHLAELPEATSLGLEAPLSPVIGGEGMGVNPSSPITGERGFSGNTFDHRKIARALIRQLDADYQRLRQGDTPTLESTWRDRLGLLGQTVVAECIDGSHRGRLAKVAWSGLELQTADGRTLRLLPESVRHLYLA